MKNSVPKNWGYKLEVQASVNRITYLMRKPILLPFYFLVKLSRVLATNLKLRSIPIRHKSFLEKKGSLRTSTLDKSGSVPSARRIIIRLTLKCQKIQIFFLKKKLISSQLQQKPVQYKRHKSQSPIGSKSTCY